MREEILNEYQEDATEGASTGLSEVERQEQEELREQVLEVLGMPGYSILHNLMVSKVQEATARLTSGRTLTMDQLRFEQGVIEGIKSVQSRFVSLSKAVKEE